MRLGKNNKGFVENWVYITRRIMEQKNHIFRDSIIRNLLQCLFLESNDKMKRYFNDGKIKSNRREVLFREFMLMVKDHCREYREVDYYASRLFITPRYLSFICSRSANNLSPKKIIDMQAVLEIKILLETTNDPMQKIAEQMNFPDQSYFGRFFKRYTGQSPLSYRFSRKE
ncbi:MAG: helix-turn-helix transcriptional regulator [Alistipes sp.]|nr:helix-turn-helix transcriptional regulator [Alistipes sp.]